MAAYKDEERGTWYGICVSVIEEIALLFTCHCPARCFGINMPKSRDIQAKIPLPQAIWNEFWLRYCERSEQ